MSSMFDRRWFEEPEDPDVIEYKGIGLQSFKTVFTANNNANTVITLNLGRAQYFRDLTIYILDDNSGPVSVNPVLLVEGVVHAIGDSEPIYDGVQYNALRFNWHGEKPMSMKHDNYLTVACTNYCGDDISQIMVTGSVFI